MRRYSTNLIKATAAVCFLFVLLTPMISNTGLETPPPSCSEEETTTLTPMNKPLDNLNPPTAKLASIIDMDLVNYNVTYTTDFFEGYTLFVLFRRHRSTGVYTNNLIIMDTNGSIIAQKDVGEIGNFQCPAEFIDPNTVLVGTSAGAQIWHIDTDTWDTLGFTGHHEYEYNPNNDTVFTFEEYAINLDGYPYKYDYIREYSLNGTLVWTMDTRDFIPKEWWCPYGDTSYGNRDLTHSNTLFYEADDDMIYYNSRNTNTFWKIDHSTSEVLWGVGEYGNFTLYNINGVQKNNLFYHAHALEMIGENKFLIFDNDHHNQTDANNKVSRLVEITINETTMTANETWVYAAPYELFSLFMGDADPLPNGHCLGAFAYLDTTRSDLSCSFVEVNNFGEIVWRTDIAHEPNYIYGAYRVEKFRQGPVITPAPDIYDTTLTSPIEWDVFFNYRTKQILPGNYSLYVDDLEVETGSFNYSKFWLPTTLSLSPGPLGRGPHNVTLMISDGYGNFESDYVNVTIGDFSIDRSGNTIIEKGQLSSLPTWSGFTNSTMSYNITLNETLYTSSTWNGEDILLDPDIIAIGGYNVVFRLFNGYEEVYTDAFWLQVTPSEPPNIIPLQSTDISLNWSDTRTLSWNVLDVTAESWSLFVNGSFIDGATMSPPGTTVNWQVPPLDDGRYNLTLVAMDATGQQSISTSWLTILPPLVPQILSSPGDLVIEWLDDDAMFMWEVYSGTTWNLEKNGISIRSGEVTGHFIEVSISDWKGEDWRPGNYSLTLIVSNEYAISIDTINVEVIADPGDPYVDDFIPDRSFAYIFGENAIGAPDDIYAVISFDYTHGYLTLDMGENEEITDGVGFDFEIVANGDDYSVYVSNSLETTFQLLGHGNGNQSFDLSPSGLSESRYIRIEIFLGEIVNLDAIVALSFNTPPGDTEAPVVIPLDDFTMTLDDVTTSLTWNVSDATPWTYEVLTNSTVAESGWWDGSSIEFVFEPDSIGVWNITLVLADAFGNLATDSVLIDVRIQPNTPGPDGIGFPLLIISGVATGALVVILMVWRLKLRNL
jgi:hypothetical protein